MANSLMWRPVENMRIANDDTPDVIRVLEDRFGLLPFILMRSDLPDLIAMKFAWELYHDTGINPFAQLVNALNNHHNQIEVYITE